MLTNNFGFVLAPEIPIPTRRAEYNYNWNLVDTLLKRLIDTRLYVGSSPPPSNDYVFWLDTSTLTFKVFNGEDWSAIALLNTSGKLDPNRIPFEQLVDSKSDEIERKLHAIAFFFGGD